MRKFNGILARVVVVLFLIHAMMGCFMLQGRSSVSCFPLTILLLFTVIAHAILGVIATIKSVRSGGISGKWYLKQNKVFWIKRVSGVSILLLLIFHMSVYVTSSNGVYFLKEFTWMSLVSQLLFVLAIFIHLYVSLEGMLIARGILDHKERKKDWLLVLSVFMLMIIITIIMYFVQWQI